MERLCSRCKERPAQRNQRWCRACRTESMRQTRARQKPVQRHRAQTRKIPCSRCGGMRRRQRLRQVGLIKPFVPLLLCGLCRRELYGGYFPTTVAGGPGEPARR